MREVGHETILRVGICPKCKKVFAVCRRCDRGQVYCGKRCSLEARREVRRKSQRLYRQTPWGRKDHRDNERDRRERRRNETRSVGVRSSAMVGGSVRVTSPVLYAAALASRGSNGGEFNHEEPCCGICGRPGRFVRFSGSSRPKGYTARSFRMRC